MRLFLLAFAAWLALPALLFWWLISQQGTLVALLGAAALQLALPLILCCVVADRSMHPPWHKPGRPPSEPASRSSQRAASPSSPGAAARDAESEAEETAFEQVVGHSADVGTLGALVGAAVAYYEGKETDPRVDFGLDFQHLAIDCWSEEHWRKRRTTANTTTTTTGTTNQPTWKARGGAGGREIKKRTSSKSTGDSETDGLLPPSRAPSSASSSSTTGGGASRYTLRGWHVPADRARTVVLLVHGAGRDRRTFMRHVPVFFASGYASLLVDCREHGASSAQGRGVGFTTREALDVIQTAKYAREVLGYEKVVACGTSQGGASVIVAAVLADELEFIGQEGDSGGEEEERRGTDSDDGSSSPEQQSPQQAPPPHLIDLVIAENAFVSREACVGDVFSRLLGSIPKSVRPLLSPVKRALVTGAILVLRWRLGLFRPTELASWPINWSRAGSTTEGLEAAAIGGSGPRSQFSMSGAGSPSSSLLPLAPLWSPSSSLSRLSFPDLNPVDLVDRLAPRPLLLMHGLLDKIVPPVHSVVLYGRARDPKKLWLVADALHTALYNKDPQGWANTVLTFMAQHGV